MSYDTNNIFARILHKEIPSHFIYEDEFAVAFNDINPKAPVHVLVIPRGAYTDYTDFIKRATRDEIDGFMRAIAHVAEQLNVTESGYRLIFNAGPDSGQEVPHLHAHILAGKKLSVNLG